MRVGTAAGINRSLTGAHRDWWDPSDMQANIRLVTVRGEQQGRDADLDHV